MTSKQKNQQAPASSRPPLQPPEDEPARKHSPPAERSAIAKKAATDRWSVEAPPAICGSADSPLTIGGIEIECYVLKDGTRVITQASFMRSIGRNPRGSGLADENLPPFLRTQSIRPYITDDIVAASRPITFTLPRGGRAKGFRAELLPPSSASCT